ncbi:MAG: PKD domain-containing protein, partial [Candidatus Gracilibacteria bacterium]|nr:PKD domain-containing protein [Candidatus Gracilibacteria bacterium]
EYIISNIPNLSKINIDAKDIRPDNSIYKLKEITWIMNGNKNNEKKGIFTTFDINEEGIFEIIANFEYQHNSDLSDIQIVSQKITIQAEKRDHNLILELYQDSDYTPTNVRFDASKSSVENDDIVKYIYDYGNGIIEERDAINPGHRYLEAGNYEIKLSVVTRSGKTYSTTKALILKGPFDLLRITPSMKKAPVGQGIEFSSGDSIGQLKSFSWDFGDGNKAFGATTNHSYDKPGKYKVILEGIFNNNNIQKDSVDIEIY